MIKVRPDAVGTSGITPEKMKTFLEDKKIDAVLFAGGGDIDPNVYGGQPGNTMLVHRLRDDFEIALFHAARELGLPMLGICRGCQIINVASGGTVRNLRKDSDLAQAHLKIRGHPVTFVQGSKLNHIFGVNQLQRAVSTHGQTVDQLGSDIKVAAIGPKDIIEAIEVNKDNEWIIGLQFHPELTFDNEVQHKIFTEFVEQARKTHNRSISIE